MPTVQWFYYAQFASIAPAAVPAAATAITQWLAALPLSNFLVEVFNEKCGDEQITPLGLTVADLIGIVHNASAAARQRQGRGRLLASASCGGGGIPSPSIVAAADFVLLHGNGQTPAKITKMVETVQAMPAFAAAPKPIVFNEDDHGHLAPEQGGGRGRGRDGAPGSNMAAAVAANTSGGF